MNRFLYTTAHMVDMQNVHFDLLFKWCCGSLQREKYSFMKRDKV